jgi:single-stranded DNA-binding protein
MAQIIKDPELRYTPDNQTAIAEMLVQFPGQRAEDPPATLKVVGWGNLATEIHKTYHQGDRVVIEGRLNMNTIERQEGFKEKRAELTVSRIHPIGADADFVAPAPESAATPNNAVPLNSRNTATSTSERPQKDMAFEETTNFASKPSPPQPPTPRNAEAGKDLDDIPF